MSYIEKRLKQKDRRQMQEQTFQHQHYTNTLDGVNQEEQEVAQGRA